MFSVQLSWTDTNGDEDSYRIEHRYADGGPTGWSPWLEVGEVAEDVITFIHDDANPIRVPMQGLNEWRVRAERSGDFGPYSATMGLDLQPPALVAPGGFIVTQV